MTSSYDNNSILQKQSHCKELKWFILGMCLVRLPQLLHTFHG